MPVYQRIYEHESEVTRLNVGLMKRLFRKSSEAGKVFLTKIYKTNIYNRYPSVRELIDSILLILIIFVLCNTIGLFDRWCQLVDQLF